jgi:signal transduction histidine kinase
MSFVPLIRKIFRKVTFRLSLWQALIFALLAICLSYITYRLVVETIRTHERDAIVFRFNQYAFEFGRGGVEAVKTLASLRKWRAQRAFFVRVASADNTTIFLRDPDEWFEFRPHRLGNMPMPDGPDIHWMELGAPDGNVLSLAVSRLPDGGALYVGQSREDTDAMLENLNQKSLVLAAVLLPIGFAVGIFLASRALRPVHELSNTVREMIETGRFDVKVKSSKTDNEINELVQLFNRLAARIDTLIRTMRESLDNVAHDLRTPMTRLRARAQTALENENDPTLCKEALADCVEESDQTLRMLNMLMDIAEAESGLTKCSVQQVSVSAAIASAADLYEQVAEDKGVRLKNETPAGLMVLGDPTMLRRVLANLIDNAVKYTPAGGEVFVSAKRVDCEVALIVRDNGPGIAADDHPKIWDRLYRSDRSRATHGLGLGLSFVRAIVESQGGRVECESIPGKGATFRAFLPAAD